MNRVRKAENGPRVIGQSKTVAAVEKKKFFLLYWSSHLTPQILATVSTGKDQRDSFDKNKIFSISVDKCRCTVIRQRSVIPITNIDPTSMRNNIVAAVLTNPVNSAYVAETYEFRRQLKELPVEVQIREDEMLNLYF
ncbi:uncharacterized protein LOC112689891 [Sipha flava]|uniref:Uncharacterized protein LOC112689891 n=1 Tax=Sipha flava TaxID=143950 RepID=A0A8B8G9R8_9HEMI|nr:uncharacterized protein LOC112689891 [Sipha flava]